MNLSGRGLGAHGVEELLVGFASSGGQSIYYESDILVVGPGLQNGNSNVGC